MYISDYYMQDAPGEGDLGGGGPAYNAGPLTPPYNPATVYTSNNPPPNFGAPSGTPPTGGGGGGPGFVPPPTGGIPLIPPGASLQQILQGLGYTGSGSGVPTQRIGGFFGGLTGGIIPNLLLPLLGGMAGSKIGDYGGRSFVKWLQGGFRNPGDLTPGQPRTRGSGQPSQPTAPSGGPSGGGGPGGFNFGGFNPFGGLPAGFTETNRFGMGAPTFSGPGSFGGHFAGGSIFHGITLNDLLASGVDPRSNFGPGQVGRSSVPAPRGGPAFLGGGHGTVHTEELGHGALARRLMGILARTGYVAPSNALVGGPPPNAWSPWQLAQHPLSYAGGYAGNIVNPAAFGGGYSSQGSIHYKPKATD